ncbi:GNAT family N-acetyltransferase [Parapedobacter koreensis]|uniref:N-acetyltransferase domain-containing protein n=1 Tax=Parapedobacter koreensis TaxID=332977 RepID=A0A1H7F7A7_9SPHI|nr:hypothetical protein [Parapedobacter koreensis]SEK21989.1 hypothetical protein SAMN05421740_101254 [Parapedobacter koreensis]
MQLVTIKNKSQLKQFIDYPHRLYRDDPNYVPELYVAQEELLWPGKNPFYDHSSSQLFLVVDGEQIKGRVAAIYNTNHNAFTGNKDGFFGFFDSEDNQEAANILLTAAKNWLKERGAERLIGPVNLSTNDTCGLLVEGFDSPPMVMMPHNKPYYEALLVNSGLVKMTDLLAYMVERETANTRVAQFIDRMEERLKNKGIVIRQINLKDFKGEVEKIREVYNKAWDKNLGFVPMTVEEFDHAAKSMKLILDPRFCIVAEKEGQIVGFALGLPNINQIQIGIKNGRLLPTGIFKLLFQKKKITSVRVLMLGVIAGYRKLGIEACLYGRLIRNSDGTPIERAECSWMLEHNYLMNHAIEQINGKLYKRYRIFEEAI